MLRFLGWKGSAAVTSLAALVAGFLFVTLTVAQQPAPLKGSDQGLVPVNPAPPPKAVYKQTRHNFGEVQRGDLITHTFVVKNEGTGPLSITNVSPG